MGNRKLRMIIYPKIAITVLAILIICIFFVTTMSRRYVANQSIENLSETFRIIENYLGLGYLESGTINSIESRNQLNNELRSIAENSNTRITYILPDGLVIADTEEEPELMDNHKTRPEILRALSGYTASSIRFSDTLGIDMLYLASPVMDIDGNTVAVLRVAMPYDALKSAYRNIVLYTVIVSVLFLILSIFLMIFIDRRIEKPLLELSEEALKYQNLDFDNVMPVNSNSIEIHNLSSSLRSMALDLKQKIDAITLQQKEVQSVLDAMDEAIFVLNDNGEIIRTNPSALKLFASDSDNTPNLQGKYYMQVITSTELSAILEPIIRGWQDGNPRNTRRIEITQNQKSFRVFISVLTDTPEKTVLVVFNDITKLMHLEKVRSDFVANVSHELKTPVTSIKGFTETLLYQDMSPEDPQFRKFLNIIHNQTDRLQAIIEDLLTLSMLEQREKQYVFEKVNLLTIIKDSIRICLEKPANSSRDVTLDCSLDNEMVKCNPLLIEQALINLIDNALKYSDTSSKVSVTCQETNELVVVRVQDNGFGIPEELIPRIFERFFRVDKGRSRDKGGTGLGLSIVRHIAMKHNGNVSVISREGKGSTFSLQLPKER